MSEFVTVSNNPFPFAHSQVKKRYAVAPSTFLYSTQVKDNFEKKMFEFAKGKNDV